MNADASRNNTSTDAARKREESDRQVNPVDAAYESLKQGGIIPDRAEEHGRRARDAAGEAGQKASEAGSQAKDAAGEVFGSAWERTEDAARRGRDRAEDAAHKTWQTTEDAAQRGKERAEEASREARERADETARRARERAGEIGENVRDNARWARERAGEIGENVRDNAKEAGHGVKESAAGVRDAVRDEAREGAEYAERMVKGDADDKERAEWAAPDELKKSIQEEQQRKGIYESVRDSVHSLAAWLHLVSTEEPAAGQQQAGNKGRPLEAGRDGRPEAGPDYDASRERENQQSWYQQGRKTVEGTVNVAKDTASAAKATLNEGGEKVREVVDKAEQAAEDSKQWAQDKLDQARDAWVKAVEPQNYEEAMISQGLIPSNTQDVLRERAQRNWEDHHAHQDREAEERSAMGTHNAVRDAALAYGEENLAVTPEDAEDVLQQSEGGGAHADYKAEPQSSCSVM